MQGRLQRRGGSTEAALQPLGRHLAQHSTAGPRRRSNPTWMSTTTFISPLESGYLKRYAGPGNNLNHLLRQTVGCTFQRVILAALRAVEGICSMSTGDLLVYNPLLSSHTGCRGLGGKQTGVYTLRPSETPAGWSEPESEAPLSATCTLPSALALKPSISARIARTSPARPRHTCLVTPILPSLCLRIFTTPSYRGCLPQKLYTSEGR